MNKTVLIIVFTILSYTLFILGIHSDLVFAQIQSTQSAIQSAQPGQAAQPQQLGQPSQPGPTVYSDHTGQNQSGQAGQNQSGQAEGPLEQIGASLGKIIGQK
ncbi:MAG: hypothetical protein M3Z01_01475 [Thermoproteota archaeon]|nr:hypothetical protein [Thermoproteota archaeon]